MIYLQCGPVLPLCMPNMPISIISASYIPPAEGRPGCPYRLYQAVCREQQGQIFRNVTELNRAHLCARGVARLSAATLAAWVV